MDTKSRAWLAHALAARPLTPRYAHPDEFQGIAAITAVPFNCYLRGEAPDKTNAAIACIAADYVQKYRVPFLGQWEHTNLLRQYPVVCEIGVYEFSSTDGERVESQRLVKWQAEQICKFGPNRKIATVGLPEHLGRVVVLQEYFGLRPKVAPQSEYVPYDASDRPGAQTWCKSYEQFAAYERWIARPGTIAKSLLKPSEF